MVIYNKQKKKLTIVNKVFSWSLLGEVRRKLKGHIEDVYVGRFFPSGM